MEEKLLFTQPFYKRAITLLEDGEKEIKQMINAGYYKKTAIMERANEVSEKVQEELNTGYYELKQTIGANKAAIRAKYQQNPNYTNPSEEVLRRQDFDMRLQLMAENEVLEMVQEAETTNTLTAYDLNALKLYLNNHNFKDSRIKDDIFKGIMKIEDVHNLGKEWLVDPEYQKNQQLEIEVRQMGPSMIWVKDDIDGFRPVGVTDRFNELMRGYN
ncbi:hypothetical protein PML78_10595 [Enterococcus dispar]|jgi:hypothetical protein|uniref:hypothetical protein n=1 Tax=Enterococcus dispar TaxID=44009 RepID=UPI00232E48BC|nr:hypothetical protein [Enterococcus dispar]WCG32633.1 hypothetical protein PML78_10595 [Enterococcus dispar]